MDSYIFRVVLENDEDVFHAYCPSLKGCHTWGYTQEEALAHIREAAEAYVEDLIKAGESIPAEALERHARTSFPVSPSLSGALLHRRSHGKKISRDPGAVLWL